MKNKLTFFKKNQIQIIDILFLFLVIFSFLNSLYYVFADYRDEIGYLSDSLLLFEGMRPSYSHAPSGISTWFGASYVFFELLFNLFKNLSDLNLYNFFQIIDLTIYSNYLDLTKIKISLFLLNIIFLIILLYISKNKIFNLLFCLVFFSPLFYFITFSGKPYFLACLFASIAMILSEKKNNIAIIFLALAISERLEFFLIINYILPKDTFQKYLKKLVLVLLIFFAVSPWFTSAMLQNFKVIFGYVHVQPSITENYFGLKLNILFLLIFLTNFFIYPYLKLKKIYSVIFLSISLIFFLLITYFSNIPLRWFLPISLIIIFYLSNKINEKKRLNNEIINLFKFLPFVFLIFFNINLKNKFSDLEILKLEENFENSYLIGPKLLKETSSFSDYSNFLDSYLYKYNAKNNLFFRNENAPLVFGQSGNLEILQNRRYEFLNKYENNKSLRKKFIFSDAGLYKSIDFYCNFLKKNNSYYYNFEKKKYIKCE